MCVYYILSCSYRYNVLFSQRLEHLGDTLFLLLYVRVNIEIKGCCNIGMTEQYAYGLVVAVAFNAACGKAVAESVVFQPWNVKVFHQPIVVVAVSAWFSGLHFVGQHIVVWGHHLFQRPHHRQEFLAHGYLTARVFRLGRIDD